MKILKYLFAISALMFVLSSCYKEEYFLDDNTTSNGRHFPVLQTVVVDNEPETGFTEGSTVEIVVHYFSVDPILQYELYETVGAGSEALYSTTPYKYTYDPDTQSEVVTLNYVVPAGSSGEGIGLNVVIVNENGLVANKSTSIDVN